ncbi:hypothetical protein BRC67_04410 [Halobacteriales archaeon QH_3_68_24]|nr:MAG: hypothetical protein BRC67_04410 [Halobacteriales archaeon QH_3_68_24]
MEASYSFENGSASQSTTGTFGEGISPFILSDTGDATAPVTVSGSSRCMSPNVDDHVHVLVSDSIRLHTTGKVSWDNQTDTYETDQWANDTVTPTRSNPSGSAAASTRSPRAWTSPSATICTG